jgi:NhaP-type Na+/H+ or K+/H+ antiporter
LSYQDLLSMFVHFIDLSVFSILIGILFGLLNAYIFKTMRDLAKYHVREIFLLILFAYASYITSEMLGFSWVITLFCCGLTQSYYAF